MTAARYDITIDQGSDFSLELTVKESGDPKNFSNDTSVFGSEKGWDARAFFRKSLEDTTSHELTCTVTPSSLGKLTVTLGREASAAITAGTYYYDLEIFQKDISSTATNPPAEFSVTRLLGGTLTLRREVTR